MAKDDENIINTFVKKWKHQVLYRINNDKTIHTHDVIVADLNKNYNEKCDIDQVSSFIEEARKHVIKENHGLLFVISSHGDEGKIFYDSDCEKIELDLVCAVFSPEFTKLGSTSTESLQPQPQPSLQSRSASLHVGIKIKEKTKRSSTTVGNLYNFTQVVELK